MACRAGSDAARKNFGRGCAGGGLAVRAPDAGEEKDDEREGEDVVQDPTLRQEPPARSEQSAR